MSDLQDSYRGSCQNLPQLLGEGLYCSRHAAAGAHRTPQGSQQGLCLGSICGVDCCRGERQHSLLRGQRAAAQQEQQQLRALPQYSAKGLGVYHAVVQGQDLQAAEGCWAGECKLGCKLGMAGAQTSAQVHVGHAQRGEGAVSCVTGGQYGGCGRLA